MKVDSSKKKGNFDAIVFTGIVPNATKTVPNLI